MMKSISNFSVATGVNAWSGAFAYAGVPFTAQVDQVSYVPATGAAPVTVTASGGCNMLPTSGFDPLLALILLLASLRLLRRKTHPAGI